MELTDSNYENIIKNNEIPVLIDFYSPTCGPCQMLTKLIDQKLEKYGEENGVKVVKCDISNNPKLASAFRVRSKLTAQACAPLMLTFFSLKPST